MPINLRARHSTDNPTGEATDPVMEETTVDGQTFAWGPGQKRSFGDDGIGAAHADFGSVDRVFENNSLATTVADVETFPSRS